MKISVAAFARGIGISRQWAHKLLAERKGITPEVGRASGSPCSTTARRALAETLDRIETRCA